jgi:peptide/nickel transport system substrate-binding protein
MDRKLRRRDFLKVSSLTFLGAVAAACTPAATETAVVVEPTAPPEEVVVEEAPVVAEPPFLEAKVKSGELPPKDERLPESPMVVADREAVGVYGGEVRMNSFDPVWWVSTYDIINERMLIYAEDGKSIVPNILESWEVSPDGKEWTMKLRKGMKWSDGQPFTTEDIKFWWVDNETNTEISSSPGWQFRFGGKNMEAVFSDDVTFKFTFAAPFGNFAAHLTRWNGDRAIFLPAHYLKQFHATYTDKATLEAAAKEAKFETWVQYYNSKVVPGVWGGPAGVLEYPRLFNWNVVSNPKEGTFMWERNPYYWKVDVAGNQLPYIDTMRIDFAANTEVTKLKIAQSELDIVGQHEVTMMEYPFYKENEPKANFKVGDYISSMGDRVTVFPYHTLYDENAVLDEGLTNIVRDYRWVQALSVAINRDEINESIFFGTARMGQMSPMPASKYYKEEYGTAWAQYDPDLANKLLDEMGLKKGADGFRTRPDGTPLKYNMEHSGIRVGPAVPKVTEMIITYWREVGIDATVKEIQDALLVERKRNGQVHTSVWHADRCTDMLFHIEPQWFIPTSDGGQGGCDAKWGQWYLAPDKKAEGLVEPPDDIKNLLNTFDQMTSTVDENERIKLGQTIFDYLVDHPLEIGLILECPAPLLFNKNLRNLPYAKAYIGWDSYGLSTYHPEAFFYEGGVRA